MYTVKREDDYFHKVHCRFQETNSLSDTNKGDDLSIFHLFTHMKRLLSDERSNVSNHKREEQCPLLTIYVFLEVEPVY